MKKVLLSMVFAAAMMTANAQTMTSKNGTPILPEAGDWSIGFDVVPVLQDFGNVFHTTNEPNTLSQTPLTLVGLHVVDATTAYRMMVRIGFGSTTTNNEVNDDATSTATVPTQVTDAWKHSYDQITLGFGIQKSIGNGRLHGIYGAELAVMFGSMDDTYSYGNPYTTTDQAPTSTNFLAGAANGIYPTTSQPNIPVGDRYTEIKSGSTFGIALQGFIGAEYFFAPKMSLSAEYHWGLGFNSTGEGSFTVEGPNGTTSTTHTLNNPGSISNFALDVTDATQIVMHLYF